MFTPAASAYIAELSTSFTVSSKSLGIEWNILTHQRLTTLRGQFIRCGHIPGSKGREYARVILDNLCGESREVVRLGNR